MRVGQFLFIFTGIIIYGLLFSEQRMESREKQAEINKLTQELEILNARKQELTSLITKERERLISQAQKMGSPLTHHDIIIID